MFDNLKKKLGSFRKDAEEAAEENVEAVDADELEDGELDDAGLDDGAVDADELEGDDLDDADSDKERKRASAADSIPDAAGASLAEDEAAGDAGDEQGPTDSEGDLDASSDAASSASASETAESDDDPTDSGGAGFGKKAKSLVTGKFVIEEEDLEGPLQELELALLSSDVEMSVADEIVENIRTELVGETRTFTTSTGAVVEEALKEAILEVISVGQFDFPERVALAEKPLVIVFTGVNGVGKTTSIAKLDRWFEARGYDCVMANGDTYRAGANEQIAEHAAARETKLISHEQGGDPAAVLYDAVEYAEAHDVDVVLGDTAGRLHTDEGLMDQLAKIDRVVGPDMTLFVDEAVAGQDAVNRAREFNEAAAIDGVILTKADADANGGAAISIAHVTGKPILFLGVGQEYDDLEVFEPAELVDRLLEAE